MAKTLLVILVLYYQALGGDRAGSSCALWPGSAIWGRMCSACRVLSFQDSQKAVEVAEAECRGVLQRLFPSVPLPASRVSVHMHM